MERASENPAAPVKEETAFLSIATAGALLRDGKVSPVDLVEGCRDRITRTSGTLNAFITLNDNAESDALTAAAEMKSGKWRGPLHGIPIALKDFYDTADMRTTAAFVHFQNRSPAKDAEVVTRLRKAGAILIGKTNMHQLGMGTTSTESFFGAVHNPWNLKAIAGGSSGGSAAAVAAGLCYATIDTDAVGSCRLPASCCGVIGFKGTFGSISTQGILDGEKADEMILQLAHAGITCRTAEDTAILWNILSDRALDRGAVSGGPSENIRIGIMNGYKAEGDVEQAFRETVRTLRALECVASLSDSPTPIPLSRKPSFKAKDVTNARASIAGILFQDFELLISPTTTASTITIEEAGKRGPLALSPENTFFANYFGLPAVSVPCGFDANGMPVGLQIVGPPDSEGRLLQFAHVFLKSTGWHLRRPHLLIVN